mgnify:CR=1 FL=1
MPSLKGYILYNKVRCLNGSLQDEYYMIDNQLDSRSQLFHFGLVVISSTMATGTTMQPGPPGPGPRPPCSQAHQDRDHDHHGSQVPQDQGHDPQDRHHVRHDGEIVKNRYTNVYLFSCFDNLLNLVGNIVILKSKSEI